MKRIYILIKWYDLESPSNVMAFENKRLLNKYIREHKIDININDLGQGWSCENIELKQLEDK